MMILQNFFSLKYREERAKYIMPTNQDNNKHIVDLFGDEATQEQLQDFLATQAENEDANEVQGTLVSIVTTIAFGC